MSSSCETIFPIDGVAAQTAFVASCFAASLHIIMLLDTHDAALPVAGKIS
jgi:hypothetical protein